MVEWLVEWLTDLSCIVTFDFPLNNHIDFDRFT